MLIVGERRCDEETGRKIVLVILITMILSDAICFGSIYMILNSKIQNLQSELFDARTTINDLQGNLSRAEFNLGMLDTTVNTFKSELSRARSDINTLRGEMSKAKSDFRALNSTVTRLQNGLGVLNTTVRNLQSDFAVLDSLVGLMKTLVTDLETNLTKAQGDIDEFNRRLTELERRLNFTDFKDEAELKDWLRRDNTSEYEYVPGVFDCDDLALTLMVHGSSSGYKIGIVVVYYTDELWYIYYDGEYYWKVPLTYWVDGYFMFGNHMANLAYVETVGWVLIEPKTDAVYELGTHEP